ncbi:MAG: DUF4266 domain-containing protein, partial [Planctomycetes bacterium]|nr:DUF4266 domain-containing protein [Planctomycetota bacterium]
MEFKGHCKIASRSWLTSWLERALLAWLLVVVVLTGAGCSTTQFFEREKLNDRAAQFDQDGGLNYLRQKIEAAREGSLGGFGSAEAGGCGCQ